MALPQDFWQNEHMFYRFRSKPCQRLMQSGICEWHSQCQFSHDTEWPRRPPNKHGYSPALCPHIRPIMSAGGGVNLENNCPAGPACRFAHTKDEVLYHPHIFKTSLCEEHRTLTSDQRSARRSKHRPRCHRYYCPFAHGKQELRTSPLSPEQRETLIRHASALPHAVCCEVCTHNQLGPAFVDAGSMQLGNSGTPFPNNVQRQPDQEASNGQAEAWPIPTPILGQLSGPGDNSDNRVDSKERASWGSSPWLQPPPQHQASSFNAGMKMVGGTKEDSVLDAGQKDDDCELDVESEIYARALRLLDELSTEDSDAEHDRELSLAKDLTLQSHLQKGERSTHGIMPGGWNPPLQHTWAAGDLPKREPWKSPDGGFNYWHMPCVDRVASVA